MRLQKNWDLLDKVLEDRLGRRFLQKRPGESADWLRRKGERWRKQKSSDQSVNNFEPDLKREGRFVIIVKLGEKQTGEVMNEKIKVLGVSIKSLQRLRKQWKRSWNIWRQNRSMWSRWWRWIRCRSFWTKEEKPYIDEFDLTFAGDKSILEAAGVTDSKIFWMRPRHCCSWKWYAISA